jgi:hypothetical protein
MEFGIAFNPGISDNTVIPGTSQLLGEKGVNLIPPYPSRSASGAKSTHEIDNQANQ